MRFWVSCGFLGLLGAFLVWGGQSWQRNAADVASWPGVDGSVDWAVVQDATVFQGRKAQAGYGVEVAYQYVIDGTGYFGRDQLMSTTNLDEANRQAREVGDSITVYVDPEDPESSTLTVPTPAWGIHPATLIGMLILGLVGFGVVVVVLRTVGLLPQPEEDR